MRQRLFARQLAARTVFYVLFAFFALLPGTIINVTAQVTFFEELFDASGSAAPPTVVELGAGWAVDDGSSSTGSGAFNLSHTGQTRGRTVLGPVNLGIATGATLSWLARRTGTYPQDSLSVHVGASPSGPFITLAPPGLALPAATSSWAALSLPIPDSLLGGPLYIVWDAFGGTSSGSNLRLDDIRLAGDADLSLVTGELGFAVTRQDFDLEAPGGGEPGSDGPAAVPVQLPVDLSFPGPDSLAGLQFDVTWDRPWLSSTGLSTGLALADTTLWAIHTSAPASQTLRVLITPKSPSSGAALQAGLYPGLVTLTFDAAPPAATDSVAVSLSAVIASAAAPDGHDILLPGGERAFLAHFAASTATFSLGDDTGADLGGGGALAAATLAATPAGGTSVVTVYVRNRAANGDLGAPGGTGGGGSPLTVDSLRLSHDLFNVGAPDGSGGAGGPLTAPFTVAPADSAGIAVTFSPSPTRFGFITAELTIFHSAPTSPDTLIVRATGTGGRGDTDQDGAVDVADIVRGVDMALGLAGLDLVRFDLFPFPSGDALIDVRDITVATQAVMNNAWPDAVVLPAPAPPDPAAAGSAAPGLIARSNNPVLTTAEPLRALQIEWIPELGAAPERRVDVRWPGDEIPPGDIRLPAGELLRVVTVNTRGQKKIAYGEGFTATHTESEVDRALPHTASGLELWPNPWRAAQGGVLSVRLRGQAGGADTAAGRTRSGRSGQQATLYDALGRVIMRTELRQTGRDANGNAVFEGALSGHQGGAASTGRHLVPGLYFVRAGRHAAGVVIQ